MRRVTGKKKDKRNGVKRESYNIPDQIDLDIWHEEFKKLSKQLSSDGYRKPITETELVAWVRRKLDEVWMKCPQKLAFLAKMRVPDYNPDTRRASMWVCNICKEGFSATDIQVDHISGEHEFTKLEQLVEFANKRFMVGYNDLQCLCIPCHQNKTLAERMGVTLEEAKVEKQVIAICKGSVSSVQAFLLERGITPASNGEKRRNQVREALRQEESNG